MNKWTSGLAEVAVAGSDAREHRVIAEAIVKRAVRQIGEMSR